MGELKKLNVGNLAVSKNGGGVRSRKAMPEYDKSPPWRVNSSHGWALPILNDTTRTRNMPEKLQ